MSRPAAAILAAAATVITSTLLASGGTAAAAPASAGEEHAAPGWIVVLRDGTAPNRVADEHSRRYDAQVGHVYRAALNGYSAQMSAAAVARVSEDPRVLFVQRDGVVHATAPARTAPGNGKGPGGKGPAPAPQVLPTGVNRVNADASATAAIDGLDGRVPVDVAVIDTGVDLDHPDLNVNIEGAKNCSTGRSADDGNGHGTHVAGTIGALDNGEGVVGVAPGARIWPVRVLNNAGSGTYSSILCGIEYVTANADRIQVANMSLGGPGSDDDACGVKNDDAMHQAICASVAEGVTYVVAAGNDSKDAANSVPAAYDEVITVSALADFDGEPGGGAASTCRSDVDDTFADFSNYGPDVDLIAPGVCILSTWKGGGYNTISGTSMASPHVAGGAALYLAGHPGTAPADVRSALLGTGSGDWNGGDDPDGVHEPLLDVTGY
jgi:subtilisin